MGIGVSVFAIVVALAVFGQQVLGSRRSKKFLKAYADEHHVDIQSTARPAASYVKSSVPVVFCLLCVVYVLLNYGRTSDALSYVTLLAILAITFSASIVTSESHQCIFYAGDVFLWENGEIRFRDVKELISSRWKASEVILRKGKTIKVSKRQLSALKELCEGRQIRVKCS